MAIFLISSKDIIEANKKETKFSKHISGMSFACSEANGVKESVDFIHPWPLNRAQRLSSCGAANFHPGES